MNEKQTVRFNRPFDNNQNNHGLLQKNYFHSLCAILKSLDSKTSCDPTCETAARKKNV